MQIIRLRQHFNFSSAERLARIVLRAAFTDQLPEAGICKQLQGQKARNINCSVGEFPTKIDFAKLIEAFQNAAFTVQARAYLESQHGS